MRGRDSTPRTEDGQRSSTLREEVEMTGKFGRVIHVALCVLCFTSTQSRGWEVEPRVGTWHRRGIAEGDNVGGN